MEQPATPIAFKVRTQGRYNGKKGGVIKAGVGGAGALWYFDKTFTVATNQDQWVCVPTLTSSGETDKTFHPATMNDPTTASTKPFRYLSVCSGMEAASVAWHPLGWEAAGFSEIEPFPAAILAHRFPNTKNYGDLTQHHTWPIEPGTIDLLVGGTPCQSFSVAGLRKGLADPRGNLALTFLGLADRLRPRWIVWENVPGVLSSGGGRDFGSFLGALVELGYGFAYRVLDAQHFGVPQRRRRVFVVAHLGDWRAPAEVLSLAEGLRGHLEAGGKKRKGAAADAGAGAEAGGGCWWDGGQISQTLDAVLQKGQTMPEKNRFPAVLQPKPVFIDRAAFNQGVNAQYEPHIEESETMDSLVARGPHAVGQPIPIQDGREIDKKQNGLGVANQGDPAYTIDTTGAQAIAIQGTIIGRGENAGPQGVGATEGGPMFTLTKTDIYGVAQPIPYRKAKRAQSTTDDETWVEGEVSNTLNNFDLGDTRTTHAVVHCSDVAPTIGASGPPYSRTGNERVEAEALAVTFQPGNLRRDAGADPSTEATTTLKATAGDQMPHVATPPPAMAVRRLTPVECERLQGFPDNWSRIPWKGKPEEDCPDGPRYKACGNSMAVPVMAWIGRNIANHEAKQAR